MATIGFQDFTPPDNTRTGASQAVTLPFFNPIDFGLGDGSGTATNQVTLDGELIAAFSVSAQPTTEITQYSREYLFTVEGPITPPPFALSGVLYYYTLTPVEGWEAGTHTFTVDGDLLTSDYTATRTFEVPAGASYIPDWESRNRDRLIEQFSGQPLIQGWLDAYTTQVQDLEKDLDAMIYNRDITNALGVNLDRIGEIFGVPRDSRLDDWVDDNALASTLTYRDEILLARDIAISEGNEASIVDVFLRLVQSTGDVEWDEAFPKAVILRAKDHDSPGTDAEQDAILVRLRRAAPAGTQLEYVYSLSQTSDADIFRFSTVADTTQNSQTYGTENGDLCGAAVVA